MQLHNMVRATQGIMRFWGWGFGYMQRIRHMGAQGGFTSLAWLLVTLMGKASTIVGDLMGDASLFTLPT